MKSGRTLILAVLGLLALERPALGLDQRATLSLEYDDNPFETLERRRSGWINRLYVESSGRLIQTSRGGLQARHQWGLKRFWRAEETGGARGDVAVNQLELSGAARLHRRLALSWGTELKLKNVQRISSEESYLRGALWLNLKGQVAEKISGVLRYRRGEMDARNAILADGALRAVEFELGYGHSRRLQGRLSGSWHGLDYGRLQLVRQADGALRLGAGDQADRLREIKVHIQFYRAVLGHVSYAFVQNRSNSVGSAFRAHRLQLLLSRYLVGGIGGQAFLILQRRNYEEEFSTALPTTGIEESEYEHNLFSIKFFRKMTARYHVSWKYTYARNGSRQGEGSYRKNIYGLSLDISIWHLSEKGKSS